MTAHELLSTCRAAGIVLAAAGDAIDVDAPVGALTPELRAEVVRLKPELVALLAPPDIEEMVYLRGGLVVPLPAVRLALDLEDRGFKMALDEGQQFRIEGTSALTDNDQAAIHRWREQLGAILAYDADAHQQ